MATRDDRLSHLALPLIIQESLLPRTQGATEFHRKYGNTDISLSGGVQ